MNLESAENNFENAIFLKENIKVVLELKTRKSITKKLSNLMSAHCFPKQNSLCDHQVLTTTIVVSTTNVK